MAEYLQCLYWSAPETLTQDSNDCFISEKPEKPADVYSCGVIAFEVFTDLLPFENQAEHATDSSEACKILLAVQMNSLRPIIPAETKAYCVPIADMILSMWTNEPHSRPTFSDIQRIVKTTNPKSRSIVDSMMQAMEAYALSLEDKVVERTRELEKLTGNMQLLLYSKTPPLIAARLAQGLAVSAEVCNSCTLFFSDIAWFASLALAVSPADTVRIINALYSGMQPV